MKQLQQLFKNLTLSTAKDMLITTCKRFWVQLSCATILAIMAVLHNEQAGQPLPLYSLLTHLSYILCFGALIDFTLVMWGQNPRFVKHARLTRIILWLLLVVYLAFLTSYKMFEQSHQQAFWLANFSIITTAMLMAPFICFINQKAEGDLFAYNLMMKWVKYQVLIVAATWVISGALVGLSASISLLFGTTTSPNGYLYMAIIILWMCVWAFCMLIPQREQLYDDSTTGVPILQKGVMYVILPLLLLYIVVLLVYALRILIAWELPEGMVSYLVSGVMFGYILCYTFLYPRIMDTTSRLSLIMRKIIPACMLPLLILMTIGIIRRVADYGITVERLYLITLLLWFYGVCIIVFVQSAPRLRWIFLSFAALFLISSAQPFNYTMICERVHTQKFEQLLEQHNLPLRDWDKSSTFHELPEDVQQDINEKKSYIIRKYGVKSLKGLGWTARKARC